MAANVCSMSVRVTSDTKVGWFFKCMWKVAYDVAVVLLVVVGEELWLLWFTWKPTVDMLVNMKSTKARSAMNSRPTLSVMISKRERAGCEAK